MDSVVSDILDDIAPIQHKKRKFKASKSNNWLSPEALSAKRRRRKLERAWQRTGTAQSYEEYRKHCRATNKLITDSRKKHFADMVKSSENSKQRWSTIQELLHPPRTPSNPVITTSNGKSFSIILSEFLTKKISDLKSNITQRLAGQPPSPMKSDRNHLGDTLSELRPATTEEVLILLKSMHGKHSPLDTIPTVLLKKCADIFAPVICRLVNLSFREGVFPDRFKKAQVTPLIKKAGLDPEIPANYRPISNLVTISKVLERLFLTRLKDHISQCSNFTQFQSAYRQYHSTETAMLKILNDVYTTADGQRSTCLVALDLSAAFDTLDHATIIDRLRHTFGIESAAIDWLTSYLTNRSQFVKFGDVLSPPTHCSIGVPQGSVLGPILFSLFISPVAGVISNFGVSFHQFADDTQLYIGIDPKSIVESLDILDKCSRAVLDWFTNNGLALNPSKSEVLFMGTRTKLHSVGNIAKVSVTGCDISPAESIKNLGVTLDSELTLCKHVSNICKTSHYHIRALRHIRQSVDFETAKTIGCAIVGSRLDYCNSILYGTSAGNLKKLQTVQNALARVVSGKRKYDRITPTLIDLHWLPVAHRINFKLATIVYKTKIHHQPEYLDNLLVEYKQPRVLRSSADEFLAVPRTRTVLATRAFSVAAPKLWNTIPIDIRNSLSLVTFKSKLKTFLFRRAYAS